MLSEERLLLSSCYFFSPPFLVAVKASLESFSVYPSFRPATCGVVAAARRRTFVR